MSKIAMSQNSKSQATSRVSSVAGHQASSMNSTAQSYGRSAQQLQNTAQGLRAQAESLQSQAESISAQISAISSEDPDEVAAAIASLMSQLAALQSQISDLKSRAAENEAYAAALSAAKAALQAAIAELNEVVSERIADIENFMEQLVYTDRAYSAKLRFEIEALQDFSRMLNNLKESFSESFPIDSKEVLEVASVLAIIASGVSKVSPAISNAVDRFREVAQSVVNTAMDINPKLAGHPLVCASGLDPINLSTGNFYYSKEDITVPGRYPIVFRRFYNTLGGFDGILGKNWTHNYNIRLFNNDDKVHIVFDDGHVETYTRVAEGIFVAPLEYKNTLMVAENENGEKSGFHLTLSTTERYSFDEKGALRCIDDTNGNKTILEYDKADEAGVCLTKVSTKSGSISFFYNDEGYISEIVDHAERKVSFEYADGQLCEVLHCGGAKISYKYNPSSPTKDTSLISEITNPLGNRVIKNEYDGRGRAIAQYFADGGIATLKYDDKLLTTTTTEQNGNKTIYMRDERYRTTKIMYESIGSSQIYEESFEYDEENNRTKYIDRNKNSWRYSYDIFGNLTSAIDPMGNNISIEYNDHNKPTLITRPNPNGDDGLGDTKVSLDYDPYGNLTGILDSIQRKTTIQNNQSGLITNITLPDESENKIEYDDRDNIISITDGMGIKAKYRYNDLNQVVETIVGISEDTDNSQGISTYFEYDQRGNITKITDPLNNTRTYEYNLLGKITKITDFDNSSISYKYNSTGKITEITETRAIRAEATEAETTQPQQSTTKLDYDLMWNVTSITTPNQDTIKYKYDSLNRMISSIDEQGGITQYEYDPNGSIAAIISPIGLRTEIRYDKLGRRCEIIEEIVGVDSDVASNTDITSPSPITKSTTTKSSTKLTYDTAGNITEIIDSTGNITKREYDTAGQLINHIDHMGNKTSFVYNPLGLVCGMVNHKGETIVYNYYPGGRLKSITLSSGEHEYYSYDNRGNMVSITKTMKTDSTDNTQSYTITLQYDLLNRLTKAIHPLGYESVFEYDAVGRITRAVSHLGDDWANNPAVNSTSSRHDRPYDPESFGIRYKTGNNNPNPQGQAPFIPSSMVGHNFMDMHVEDGIGGGTVRLQDPEYADLIVYLAHGTEIPHPLFRSPDHWTEEFKEWLAEGLDMPREHIFTHSWGGALSGHARAAGGLTLAVDIQANPYIGPDTKVLLVGYSHGGNVAITTANLLNSIFGFDASDMLLTTIATPARIDYQLNENLRNLMFHLNVFNDYDAIQILGTSHILGSLAYHPKMRTRLSRVGGVSVAESIVYIEAGRFFSSAVNRRISSYIETGPVLSHRTMHSNIDVWRNYELLSYILTAINGIGGCE